MSYPCPNCSLQHRNRWTELNRVWMIDVRDSYFQADPFSFTPSGTRRQPHSPPFFFAFTGVETRTIGACGWNGGWVKDCFGQDVSSLELWYEYSMNCTVSPLLSPPCL